MFPRRGLRVSLLSAQIVEGSEALRLTDCRPLPLPEPTIDPRQQPLGPEKRGREVQAVFQRPHRLLEPLLARQHRPQQEMPLRITELEADALGGRVGCLLCPAGAEKASGQN